MPKLFCAAQGKHADKPSQPNKQQPISNSQLASTSSFTKVMSSIITVCFIVVLAILLIISACTSYQVSMDKLEMLTNHWLFALCSVIIASFIILLIRLIRPTVTQRVSLQRIPIKTLYVIMVIIVGVVGVIWVSVVDQPIRADGRACFLIASNLASSEMLENANKLYLQEYSQQAGFVLYLEVFIRVFGDNSIYAARLFNVVCICIIAVVLCKCCEIMFGSKKATRTCIVLTTCFLPLPIYAGFIYGNIPALCSCAIASYLALKSLNATELRVTIGYIVVTGLALFFALSFKLNSLIFVVAICLVWIVRFIPKQPQVAILGALLCVFVYWVSAHAALNIIEARTNIELNDGMPTIAWISMGAQESSRGPGWYQDTYNSLYRKTNGDVEAVKNAAISDLNARLDSFGSNVSDGLGFYASKVATQWSEPTFQSTWTTMPIESEALMHKEPELLQSLACGKVGDVFMLCLDVFQSLVYFFALYCVWHYRKQATPVFMLLGVSVMGGFLFHLIWEAKSQYVISYFVLLIPYAAAGFTAFRASRLSSNLLTDGIARGCYSPKGTTGSDGSTKRGLGCPIESGR